MGMQAIPSQSQAEQAPPPKAHIYTELIQQGAGCLTVTLLAKLSICIGIWPQSSSLTEDGSGLPFATFWCVKIRRKK